MYINGNVFFAGVAKSRGKSQSAGQPRMALPGSFNHTGAQFFFKKRLSSSINLGNLAHYSSKGRRKKWIFYGQADRKGGGAAPLALTVKQM